MSITRAICALCCAFSLASCVQARSFETDPDAEPEPGIQIRLWAEDHPLLDPYHVALDGCRQWWPNEVDCVLTDAFDSTIRVNAITPEDAAESGDQEPIDSANCVPLEDGTVTLAVSRGGGWVEFYPRCFEIRDANGNVTGYRLMDAMTVMTHEVGHELGIPHVPFDCTPDAAYIRGGGGLCGEAVMNPIINAWVPSPTQVDDLAFDLFVRTVALPSAATGCRYAAPADF